MCVGGDKLRFEKIQQLITLEEVVVVVDYRGLMCLPAVSCSLVYNTQGKGNRKNVPQAIFFPPSEACLINFQYGSGSHIIYAPHVSLVLFCLLMFK